MVKQADNKKPVFADDKLQQLTERQLADISEKIRKKNSTLHTDAPVAPSTWAIIESHDTDNQLFEELCYHMFAAGFSREVVRKKWPAHRQAFAEFDLKTVSAMSLDAVDELVQDKNLIRNRRKLTAVIENAGKIMAIGTEHGSFSGWLASYPEVDLYQLHREIADRFNCVGRSAAEWFMLSSDIPYYFATDDARRLLKRLGLLPKGRKDVSFNQSIQALHAASGTPTWELSIDLWRFASGFRMREAVCGEAAPNCAKCPLWDYCDFFNQDLGAE